MSQPTPTMARTVGRAKPDIAWAGRAGKIAMASISAGTGLVSIFAFARSYGLAGAPQEGHLALGGFSAAWVGVTPASDTAFAIDDTLHLVATAKDSRGSALVGAPIRWTSDDPAIATVDAAGAVVARGAGTTAIAVTVGDRVGRARVVVAQRPVALRVVEVDSVVGEGERRQLRAYAVDARGYPIHGGAAPRWSSADTAVATVDSGGMVTGVDSGRGQFDATLHGMSVRAALEVRAVPGAIAVLGGVDQRATTESRLEQPVVVRVLSTRGRPVPNAVVRFAPGSLAGRAEPASATTDAEGRARTWWTLGSLPGRQRLLASVNDVDSSTVVIAEAEPTAANLRATALAPGQSGSVGELLLEPVGVLLTDSLGRPIVDLAVTWLAPDGGLVVPTAARTDSLGEARVQWTLGPRTGGQQLRAFVGATRLLPPVIVPATARAGAPAAATVAAGDQQRGTVAAPLARPVVVRVRDRAGNAVAGVAVTFAATDGTLADSLTTTDSTGSAMARWTLGPRAGAQRLVAQVAGLDAPLAVSVRARAAAPATVAFDSVSVPAARRAPAPIPVALTVADALGNPVAGVRLRFAARRGTVAPTTVATDSLGRARLRWTPAAAGGEHTLSATVVGAAGVTGTIAVATPVPPAPAPPPTVRAAAARPVAKPAARPVVKPVAKPVAAPRTPARSTRAAVTTHRSRAR